MITSTAEATHDTKAESLAHRVSKAIDQGKLVANLAGAELEALYAGGVGALEELYVTTIADREAT